MIDDIEIVLPSVIHQDGQDEEGGINELNEKIENLCKEEGMRFIDKNNIKRYSLNKSKSYLNKSGTALLTKKFAKVVKFGLLHRNIDWHVNNVTKDSPFLVSELSHLGNLRPKNPKTFLFLYKYKLIS